MRLMGRLMAAAVLIPLGLSILVPASGGCAAKANLPEERLCTAGAFVFCLCQEVGSGRKLCGADSKSFGACLPCPMDVVPTTPDPSGRVPPVAADGGFTVVDSATPLPKDDAGPAIDARCVGKLAVVAGVKNEVFTGIFSGDRTFSVSASRGPGVASPVPVTALNGSFFAVYRSNSFNALVETKYTSSWSSPMGIGMLANASSVFAPSLAPSDSLVNLVYLADDNRFYQGRYAEGWDEGNSAVDPDVEVDAGSNVAMKSGPGAAQIGSSLAFAFANSEGALLFRQMFSAVWGPMVRIATRAILVAPATIALEGTSDVLVAYVGSDLALHSVVRQAASKNWDAPILVDDGARPGDATGGTVDTFSLAPMSRGRAMLVFRGIDGQPFYSVYDPAAPRRWSAPAALVKSENPIVASTPMVSQGKCGEDAVVAYAIKDGAVAIERFVEGAWQGPYVVGGMTKMNFVGVGEMP